MVKIKAGWRNGYIVSVHGPCLVCFVLQFYNEQIAAVGLGYTIWSCVHSPMCVNSTFPLIYRFAVGDGICFKAQDVKAPK